MNKKGFVTSALLYGILSLYIVLVVGVISIIGNRKLANDKIKQSALDDVQNIETGASCFDFEELESGGVSIKGYTCSPTIKNVFVPKYDANENLITEIGEEAFKDKNIESITIKSNITGIYYNAFAGNSNVLFIVKGNMPTTIIPDGSTADENLRWGASDSSIRQD